MKSNEENITATRAAGYIAGVGFGFVRRRHRTFAILLLLGGLTLILVGTRLAITPASFFVTFDEGSTLGMAMIVVSIALWLFFRTPRKR